MTERDFDRLVGIYQAEGSLMGEIRYALGRIRGTAHCALCDITHGRIREKDAFKTCREALDIPLDTLHLDELPPSLEEFTKGRTPCVVGVCGEMYEMLMTAEELDLCAGSVERFESMLSERL